MRKIVATRTLLVGLIVCSAYMLCGMMSVSAGVDQKPGTASSPVGIWRGESKCVVKPSGCHDEDSVYRISAVAQAETRITLSANKIVDGREVNMWTGECSYSPETRTVGCSLPNGSKVHFQQDGDSLIGEMRMSDGTLWRKISLRRPSKK